MLLTEQIDALQMVQESLPEITLRSSQGHLVIFLTRRILPIRYISAEALSRRAILRAWRPCLEATQD
jgi:hypothetical protein